MVIERDIRICDCDDALRSTHRVLGTHSVVDVGMFVIFHKLFEGEIRKIPKHDANIVRAVELKLRYILKKSPGSECQFAILLGQTLSPGALMLIKSICEIFGIVFNPENPEITDEEMLETKKLTLLYKGYSEF